MIKFTSMGSMAQITMGAALQTLANLTAVLSSAAESNDASDERQFFRHFAVKVGTQSSARTADGTVSLLIVPVLGSIQGDVGEGSAIGDHLGTPYIATDKDGNKVQWTLDDAVTARNLTWANVCVPNSNYYVGVLNETGQAFAGTNEVHASDAFTVENAT